MKKIRILSCVLLVMCVLFCACANEKTNSPEPSGSPTEEPTVVPADAEPTTEPSEEPSPTEPANIYAPTREDLDEHDYNAVRSFLEIKDENGVKNGEKLAAINGLVYDPDDPGTWSAYSEPNYPKYLDGFDDIRFESTNFLWDENGRLCCIFMDFEDSTQDAPVGSLDLFGCSRLGWLYVSGLEITEIDVTACDSPELNIKSCPKLERIESGGKPFRYLYVTECPSLDSLTWVMMDTHDIVQLSHLSWPDELQYFFPAAVTVDTDGSGHIDIGWLDDPDSDSLGCVFFSMKAVPEEGHEFLGWYDIFGNLVSSDEEIVIQDAGHSYENLVDLIGSTVAHVVARFD